MLKPEQIPDVVVDALLDSSNVAKPWHHAIAAALNAWPGMHFTEFDDGQNAVQLRREITLPLPTEASDDQ